MNRVDYINKAKQVFKMVEHRDPLYSGDRRIQRDVDRVNDIAKDLYYLDIALTASGMSTCLRRNYGAVIVKNDRIVSTGFNGAPHGVAKCTDVKLCERERLKVPKGERYELCVASHAEENAIIMASKEEMSGATIYIAGHEANSNNLANPAPCKLCQKMIRNSGITRIVGLVGGIPTEFPDLLAQLKQ